MVVTILKCLGRRYTSSSFLLLVMLMSMATDSQECQCNESDHRHALESLFNATNGTNWANSSNWNTGASVCEWYGIVAGCKITLTGNRLAGTLPANLSLLTGVTLLDLSNNSISGTLPSDLCSMNDGLTLLNLSFNSLTGSLPESYASCTTMMKFDVSNCNLSGTLPSSYANWSHLTHFNVANNSHINGTLPTSYLNWTTLLEFSVQNNSLSGTLPSATASWVQIERFDASFNSFHGSIPSDWRTNKLKFFAVSDNQLSGRIPVVLMDPQVLVLLLNDNMLSGEVPPFTGYERPMPIKFTLLLLHNNTNITGSLPNNLRRFFVSLWGTGICGPLPVGFHLVQPLAVWIYIFYITVPTRGLAPSEETFTTLANTSGVVNQSVMNAKIPQCVDRFGFSRRPTELPTDTQSVGEQALQGASDLSVATAALLSGGASALTVKRLTLVAALRSCDEVRSAVDRFGAKVALSNAPLRLQIGPRLGSMHRGVIVGNLLFWLLTAVAAVVAVVCLRAWRLWQGAAGAGDVFNNDASSAAPQDVHITNQSSVYTFVHFAGRLRLPGALFIPVALVLQQLAVSSVITLRATSPDGWAAQDTAIGLFGLLLIALIMVLLGVVLYPNTDRFGAVAREKHDNSRRNEELLVNIKRDALPLLLPAADTAGAAAAPPPATTSVLPRLQRWRTKLRYCASWCVSASVIWTTRMQTAPLRRDDVGTPTPAGTARRFYAEVSVALCCNFVECFGLLFSTSRSGRHWWLLVDMSMTVFLGVLSGAAPTDSAACQATVWLSVAACVAWVAAAVVLQPKCRRLSSLNAVLTGLLQLTVALCAALSVSASITDTIASASGIGNVVMTFLTFGMDAWLERKKAVFNARLQEQKAQSDAPSPSPTMSRTSREISVRSAAAARSTETSQLSSGAIQVQQNYFLMTPEEALCDLVTCICEENFHVSWDDIL